MPRLDRRPDDAIRITASKGMTFEAIKRDLEPGASGATNGGQHLADWHSSDVHAQKVKRRD